MKTQARKTSIIDGVINSIVLQEAMGRIESLEAANDPSIYADVIVRLDDHEERIQQLENELAELKAA